MSVRRRALVKILPKLLTAALVFCSHNQLPRAVFAAVGSNKSLPTPRESLGFEPGAEGMLADYDQIIVYFEKLAAASPRLRLERLGKTTDGNELVLALISSPTNLQRLEEIRNNQVLLADPRKTSTPTAEKIIANSPAVVLVNCSIHATEVGPTQMSPLLAYALCAGEDEKIRRILDNTLVLLLPCHNPDGQKMVVEWYRQYKGTKYVATRPPFLYQKYVDHDNNRDWFMFTQVETRLTVEKVHNVWRPQITLDMHQMGKNGARLFVPPYIDPIEPNVDPILVGQLAKIGADVLSTLTTEGKKGVVMNAIFDAWTPARAYPHYHHGLRFLTETASADLATAVTIDRDALRGGNGYDANRASWNYPAPWPGGKWTLADIVEYNRAAALAVVDHAARNRQALLRSFYTVARKAIAPKINPYAFVIPREQDAHAVVDLVAILRTGMVEVAAAQKDFRADGATYPAGTLVIVSAQPYGAFARALLQPQKYPEIRTDGNGPIRPPYDVTAHDLPEFLAVDVIAVVDSFAADLKLLSAPPGIPGAVEQPTATRMLLDCTSNYAFLVVNELFDRGFALGRLDRQRIVDGQTWAAGTFVIQTAGKAKTLQELAQRHGVVFSGTNAIPDSQVAPMRRPRLGVYKSSVPEIDEGWTRWVLEQYQFAYTSLRDADIRAGDLRRKLEVIVLPSQSRKRIVDGRSSGSLPDEFTGGIGAVGVRQLQEFVRQGGTLLAFDAATALPIEEFYLPVRNVLAGLTQDKFYCPGSVLHVNVNNDHPLAYGMPDQATVLFVNSAAFEVSSGASIVDYPPANPLVSGWISGAEQLFNRKALVQLPYGDGYVVLYGFRPQFRGQFRATYKLFFNAILLAGEPATRR